MTQRNKRRFTALEVLSEFEKLNTREFDAKLIQDVADRIRFDGGMADDVLGYSSLDGMGDSLVNDGMRDSSVNDGMGESSVNDGLWAYGVVVSMFNFHHIDRGSNPGRGGKIS